MFLNMCSDVNLGISFLAGVKIKVSHKKLKFFRASNSLYAPIGANTSHFMLKMIIVKHTQFPFL